MKALHSGRPSHLTKYYRRRPKSSRKFPSTLVYFRHLSPSRGGAGRRPPLSSKLRRVGSCMRDRSCVSVYPAPSLPADFGGRFECVVLRVLAVFDAGFLIAAGVGLADAAAFEGRFSGVARRAAVSRMPGRGVAASALPAWRRRYYRNEQPRMMPSSRLAGR